MFVALFAMTSTSAHGEDGRRVVCWSIEGTSSETVSAARERLSMLGEVIELPAFAPPGPTPRARQLQAEASERIERARALYYEASLDEAAELLSSFVEQRGPSLAESGSIEELRTALLWLGASLAKGGRHADALEPLVLAIRLGLEEIDRSLFPPEVTSAFEAARNEDAGASTTMVTFQVLPEGSSIEVDGQAGTPMSGRASELQLAVGRHVVVARRPGYRPVAELVTIGVDAATVEMNLDPADRELIAEQVSLLGRDGELDATDLVHVTLVAQVTSADYVAVVSPDPETAVALYDSDGQLSTWPAAPPSAAAGSPQPSGAEPVDDEPRPVWRRWWFWFALIGGAAVAATGIGLGVHYGTQNRDTFTLVVRR